MTAIYAHRGNISGPSQAVAPPGQATGPARENTLDAFRAARRAGADGVELDVRLSADGVPVIHHDRRLPDGRDIANVARAGLPSWVPTLAQALDACAGLPVNVEVKHEEGDRRAAAVVAELLGPQPGRAEAGGGLPPVLVSSFDEESLVVVRAAQPSVPLGLLVDWGTAPADGLVRAAALGCATLHPFVSQVDALFVAEADGAAVGLHVWTVNADADLEAMAALGVAAVITDRVAAAVPVVGRRHPRSPGRNGEGASG